MNAHRVLPPEDAQLLRGVVVFNARAVGLALGVVSAVVLFVATNWLVLKGGDPVGPHLALLSQFFLGYHVSFLGSLIGALWAFAVGSLAGTVLGWLYNALQAVRHAGRRGVDRSGGD